NQAAIILTDAGNLANGAITMGGADSYGLEADFGIQLGGGLDWTTALGLLDCTLKNVPAYEDRSEDLRQVSPGVMDGNTCQDSSEWTFNTSLNGEWALGISDWSLTANVTLSGKGPTRLTTDAGVPGLTPPADGGIPYGQVASPEQVASRTFREWASIRDPLYLINLSAGVRNQHWTIMGYVENATNKRYAVDNFSHEGLADSTIFGLGAGNFITTLAPKRRYGLRLRYDL
ncbi:MAG: TonB-dependent receptor, partial [Pseudomonadales bacterium]